jgi:uncharacterized protein YxjI
MDLTSSNKIIVKQKRELWEMVGFETRNKYEIQNEQGAPLAFAAEQNKGFWGFIFRQFLGHWRRFNITIFALDHQPVLQIQNPFRWFFQRFEVKKPGGQELGYCQQRFGLFTKKFDLKATSSLRLLEMRSGLFKLWTFPIYFKGREVARISKKWGGLLKEMFLDADSFVVEFKDQQLTNDERQLILAASIFTDLQYFEKKAD